MWELIGTTFTQAFGIGLSPLPLVGLIVLLTERKGAGVVYLIGWYAASALGLALGTLGGNAADDATGTDAAQTGVNVGQILITLLFFYMSYASFKSRVPRGQEQPKPGWLNSLEKANIGMVFILGWALTFLNAKNLPLLLVMGGQVAAKELSPAEETETILILAFGASLIAVIVVLIALLGGKAADRMLERAKAFLIKYNPIILGVLFLMLGVSAAGKVVAALA